MPFQLSKNQENIRDTIIEFIFDTNNNNRIMRVDSGAGSGKTTIMSSVYQYYQEVSKSIDIFDENEAIPELYFTATTQPAVVQLQTVGCENAKTIYSFLNLTVGKDYKNGGTYVYQRNATLFKPDTVCIVDEASFIDETVKKYMLASGIKFILTGDDHQFLNVDNNTGVVVPFNSSNDLTNEETFRFKDPKLAEYVLTLKHNVRDKCIKQIPDNIGNSLHCLNDDQFLATLTDAFDQEPNECLVITFTNKNVTYYETNIRSQLGLPDDIRTDDTLVFKSALRHTMGYRISPSGGKTFTKIKVLEDYHKLAGLTGRLLQAESIEFTKVASKHKPGGAAYIVKDYAPVNKLIGKLRRMKAWNEFYAVKDLTAVANYGYASTAHGSQGLSVPYVFIDFTDIGTMAKIVGKDTIARMVYVSISRTSDTVFIRGKLPSWILGSYA